MSESQVAATRGARPAMPKDRGGKGAWDIILGRLMQLFGITLLASFFASALVLRFALLNVETGVTLIVVNVLLIVLIVPVGGLLVLRGKQYVARGKARAWLRDHGQPAAARVDRPTVIYLRSFAADASELGQVSRALLAPEIFSGISSAEEQLEEAIAPIGQMVAIGEPGETLPDPGAIRAYARDDAWQQTVNDWLGNARLVILRAGATEGLWWETVRAFEVLRPGRILILMLGFKRSQYDSFAEKMRTYLDIRLPDFDEVSRWRRVFGFFEFGDDWEPRFLPLRAPYFRAGSYKPVKRMFNHALRPVFQRLGVSWTPSPVSYGKVLFVSSASAFIVFVLMPGLFS